MAYRNLANCGAYVCEVFGEIDGFGWKATPQFAKLRYRFSQSPVAIDASRPDMPTYKPVCYNMTGEITKHP